MGLFSGVAKAAGSVVGDFADEIGATSTFQATPIDVDAAAFEDQNAAENKRRLDKLAAEAAAREAPTAAATIVGAAPQLQAPTIAPVAAAAPVALAPGAQVDASQQFRTGQAALTANLQSAVAGREPSVAQLQLRRGSEANIRNQAAIAATAGPGADPSAVARNLARNVQSEGQVLNEQQGILRAQEVATSRQQLSETLANARGGDIEVAVRQAGLDQQRLVEQGRITRDVALANLDAEKQLAISQGNMELAAAIENQKAALSVTLEQASLTQETSLANQAAELDNQAQIDRLVAFYTAQGLNIDAATFKARQAYPTLLVNQNIGIQTLEQQTASQNAATRGAIAGGVLGGAGAAAGALSDIRAKTNIEPGDEAVRAVLEKLKPYEFDYIDPDAPGATHGKVVGVMAQDLLKSKLGREIVNTESLPLSMDVVKALSLALASGADAHKRLKKLEQRAA